MTRRALYRAPEPRKESLTCADRFAATALFPLALAIRLARRRAGRSGEKVNQLIVYGDDPCPQSRADEITVCARKDEFERFRIPAPLRESGTSPKNEAWNNKVLAYETVGDVGTQQLLAGRRRRVDRLFPEADRQRLRRKGARRPTSASAS